MMEGNTIYTALQTIQQGLKVPKDKDGHNYKYRSVEDILEMAKPLLKSSGVACYMSDDVIQLGNRFYIKSTITLVNVETSEMLSNVGVAIEPDRLASMAPPQITGTASSYARKRALEGLFLLDNEKDVDSKEVQDNLKKQAKNSDDKLSGQGEKAKVSHELAEKAKSLGVSNETMKAIIQQKYKAERSADMSIGELRNMTANLEALAAEFTT